MRDKVKNTLVGSHFLDTAETLREFLLNPVENQDKGNTISDQITIRKSDYRRRDLPGISLWLERGGELGLQRKGFGRVTKVDAMEMKPRAQTERERERKRVYVRVKSVCEL